MPFSLGKSYPLAGFFCVKVLLIVSYASKFDRILYFLFFNLYILVKTPVTREVGSISGEFVEGGRNILLFNGFN